MPHAVLATLLLAVSVGPEPIDTALVAESPAQRIERDAREALPIGTPVGTVYDWLKGRGFQLIHSVEAQDRSRADYHSPVLRLYIASHFRDGRLTSLRVKAEE